MSPEVKKGILLAPYTTFGIGGAAEYFAVASSEEELTLLAKYAREHNLRVSILGEGSNLLVSDSGVKGLVIKNEIKGITHKAENEKVLVTAGAGEGWDAFVLRTVETGWWGLENLSAIPGTVGATPIQNVGAYGVEVGNLIEEVKVYSLREQKFITMNSDECHFGYRDSIFKSEAGKDLIVVSVTYSLSTAPNPQIHYKDLAEYFSDHTNEPSQKEIRNAVILIRSKKFPDWSQLGTAGSFFKNPVISTEHYNELTKQYDGLPGYPAGDGTIKVSLGWILDKVCNLRGARTGQVGTYENQSLVLINYGGATAVDVNAFAESVKEEVFKKTKILIEMEPQRW